jgi:hypothetical protein
MITIWGAFRKGVSQFGQRDERLRRREFVESAGNRRGDFRMGGFHGNRQAADQEV